MAERVAVVGGVRTPFVKAGGSLARYSSLDLGVHVVKELCGRFKLDPIDELVFSTVLLEPRYPNLAREIVLRAGLPKSLPAHFASNNCISGLVAVNQIVESIRVGRIRSGIAGGTESMSRPALTFRPDAEALFLKLSRARSLVERLKLLAGFRPRHFLPVPPSPREPSTGLTMGQHCEISTKEFSIARSVQDELALKSHQNASKAQDAGYLAEEIAALDGVTKDSLIRGDTTLERLAKLTPVFDRSPQGTLTAGNSSALTDGASAIALMSESEARSRNLEIFGFIEAVEFAAVDPADGLLMAPGLAVPRLFEKQGITASSIDRFEIHEAFAAQVLANIQVWEKGWKKFPDLKPIGTVPSEKVNVHGGSLAIGHPFAATGGRLIFSLLKELKRSSLNTGIISVCAAGGMAAAVLLRRN